MQHKILVLDTSQKIALKAIMIIFFSLQIKQSRTQFMGQSTFNKFPWAQLIMKYDGIKHCQMTSNDLVIIGSVNGALQQQTIILVDHFGYEIDWKILCENSKGFIRATTSY